MTVNLRQFQSICALAAGLTIIAGTFSLPHSAAAQEDEGLKAALTLERGFVNAIAQAEASVVSIARFKRLPRNVELLNRRRFGGTQVDTTDPRSSDFIPNEFAAGVVIASPTKPDSERFILTNYHAVKGGPIAGRPDDQSKSQLYVRFGKRAGYYAKIIAADPRSDLAVLNVDLDALGVKAADVKPLKLSNAKTFKKGQFVVVLGNPYAIAKDGSPSASSGIISNITRRPAPAGHPDDTETQRKTTIHHFGTLLQIDARLNLGTSGGALIDLRGRLIGITTSLAALDGYEKSIGYAIPMNAATRRVIGELTRGHEVQYGVLGINPGDFGRGIPIQFQRLRRSAAVAVSVFEGSPAAKGRLRSGDVILDVNGKPIYDRADLMREIGLLPPESVADLRVWRLTPERPVSGHESILHVRLGKWPVINEDDIIETTPRYPAWRGITVDYPTARNKYIHARRPQFFNAVLVRKTNNTAGVLPANIREGDFISHVDGKPVHTPKEFHAAVAKKTGVVSLQLVDGRVVDSRPNGK